MNADGLKNGSKGVLMGIAAALGIAVATGVVSWTFTHVVDNASTLAQQASMLQALERHDAEQDKWVDEINRKNEARDKETRDSISQINALLNTILGRIDGKPAKP